MPRPYAFLTVNRGEQSSAELAQDIVHEAQDLVRLEIELAKQELKELAIRNGIAAGLLAAGGLLVALALLVALPVFLVVLWDNHVLGAAIWLGVYAVLGIALVVKMSTFNVRMSTPTDRAPSSLSRIATSDRPSAPARKLYMTRNAIASIASSKR